MHDQPHRLPGNFRPSRLLPLHHTVMDNFLRHQAASLPPLPTRPLVLSIATAFLTIAGCKSAPPPPAPAPVAKISPFANLSDEALVHANQKDGVGLGLRIPGGPFHARTPIPFHVLLEDVAAQTSIASGLCTGLSISYEEITTHDSSTGDFTNPRCFDTLPNPDEVPLAKGELKIVEASQRNFSNLNIPPGTYQIKATWHAFPAGRGTIIERPAYTTLDSNPVQITILP